MMFTGIIQGLGKVAANDNGALSVRVGEDFQDAAWQVAESVAVNGVCLTVTGIIATDRMSPPSPGHCPPLEELSFDLSPETRERTTLGRLEPGVLVNLEHALRVGDSLGGHFVQGHVDVTGTLEAVREMENAHAFTFRSPPGYERYLIDKGSICVDGISLTVANRREGVFETWVVPHTRRSTNLQQLSPGDAVNLEFDMLAKYVERFVGR